MLLMSTEIKKLGTYALWEPIVLMAYAEQTGLYVIEYSLGEHKGLETHHLAVGDALVFSNTQRRTGALQLRILLPDGTYQHDGSGIATFSAVIF